ncbi:MAG: acetyl-CoA carboxylase biotin carboxyl carrier protein subunit [Tepidiforma sp.]|nr:MAG: acetyl-CoA carboxylase biotin carboxyl carrier protein subunit [Tepidiforma sp.]
MAKVTIGGRTYEVEVRGDRVVVDGHEFPVTVREDAGYLTVTAGSVPYRIQLPPPGERQSGMEVQVDYRPFTVQWEGRLGGSSAPRERAAASAPTGGARSAVKGAVTAQISGKVVRVNVKAGQTVAKGDVLLILEAMKMENEIKAPADGTVREVPVSEGQRVAEGDVLAVID